MGLREEIEAAFGEAAAEDGVRVLAVDGDEKVWVGGLAATDGTLEVRVGDRGPRRGPRIRVEVLWPGDDPLELPGFELDGDEKLSRRQVDADEAVAAARTALGIGPGDPLLIHLGD